MLHTLLYIIGGIGGSLATFTLQKYGLSIVVASSIVGLIGAGIGSVFNLPHLSVVVFAGSFVGMTSVSIGTIPLVVLGGAITGVLYKISINYFVGIGGRLGAMAFVSTLASFQILLLVKKYFKF